MKTKAFNLGDPISKKSARFIRTIHANTSMTTRRLYVSLSNDVYTLTTVTSTLTSEYPERYPLPTAATMPYNFIAWGFSGVGGFRLLSTSLEFTNFGRRG